MEIDLNIQKGFSLEVKEAIFIIQKVAEKYTPTTEVFVVGGLVRDGILGISKATSDLDVMVSNISGEKFARLVTAYLGAKDAHTIRSNPEKSKHITTSKAFIPLSSGKTQEVDFAQARQEVYTGDSRIPSLEPATPAQDASRRDFTCNAIFYRIYPLPPQIIDYTGNGIKDIISKTIRTPLDPLQTFKEDPLRIFRCLRFAANLGFSIDPETLAALKNPELRNDISQKVSKERIGQELEKTLKGNNPQMAIQLLKETGLFADILQVALKGSKYEGKMADLDMNQNNPNHQLNWWGHTMQVVLNTLQKYEGADPEKRMVMTLGALFHDLGKLFSEIQKKKEGTDKYPGHEGGYTTYIGHEEESAEIANLILRYLKLDPYIQQIAGLSRYHMQPHSLVRTEDAGQKALRKFIRRMGELSLNWLDVFNLAVADAYSKSKDIDPTTVAKYQQLESELQQALLSLSPSKEAKIEPVLNGNEIMAALGVKPGPHMKEITEFVKELRDENPNITKEEAVRKLQERFGPKPTPAPVSPNPEPTEKIAGNEKTKTSVCSKHLLDNRSQEIDRLIKENRTHEATVVMNSLRTEYGKDENVARLTALNTLKVLLGDRNARDNNLLTYIFDNAQTNFFDYVLGAYSLGIVLLVDTATEDSVIMDVAKRTAKLSPGTLRSVLDMLPEDKLYRKATYQQIKALLS